MYGSDQAASLEPQGMKSLAEGIDKCVLSLGQINWAMLQKMKRL